jgi:hypothetical protein
MNLRTAALFAAFALAAAAAYAQVAEVVYMEGDPTRRNGSGQVESLDYGVTVKVGESVITGRRDLAELAQGKETTIRVKPNTVFTIREIETGGKKEQVLTTAVGAVSLRFNKWSAPNPGLAPWAPSPASGAPNSRLRRPRRQAPCSWSSRAWCPWRPMGRPWSFPATRAWRYQPPASRGRSSR